MVEGARRATGAPGYGRPLEHDYYFYYYRGHDQRLGKKTGEGLTPPLVWVQKEIGFTFPRSR